MFNVKYVAQITTNGYLLTKEVFNKLIDYNVKFYQITIDGDKETHDKHRKLVGGQGTYSKIINNIVNIKGINKNFLITLRMNVGSKNIDKVEAFINMSKQFFDDDPRYEIYFQDIRYWGGNENHSDLPNTIGLDMLEKGLELNANICSSKLYLEKNSSCFAASPNSFVVGVNGQLYKCTIALYDPINWVGKLMKDGTLSLDSEKMKLWTEGGSNDLVCRSCTFAPTCHGDTCPLERLRIPDKQPCPSHKNETDKILDLLDKQNKVSVTISRSGGN